MITMLFTENFQIIISRCQIVFIYSFVRSFVRTNVPFAMTIILVNGIPFLIVIGKHRFSPCVLVLCTNVDQSIMLKIQHVLDWHGSDISREKEIDLVNRQN